MSWFLDTSVGGLLTFPWSRVIQDTVEEAGKAPFIWQSLLHMSWHIIQERHTYVLDVDFFPTTTTLNLGRDIVTAFDVSPYGRICTVFICKAK